MKTRLLSALLPVFIASFINAQTWQDVGGGLNWSSHGMCTWNGMLVAGGSFNSPCKRVAGWNGTAWNCFDDGVGIVARAVIEYNGDLIACGDFWNVFQPCAGCNGIARWDGSSWQPLGNGFNNDMLCMTIWNGNLVVGGDFEMVFNGDSCLRVAMWNGISWSSIGGGVDTAFRNDVRTLAVYNGELWAGGDFKNANGCSPCDRVVKWNGTAWVGGNSGVDISGGVDSTVRSFYVDEQTNLLYMGGHFIEVDGNPNCKRIAVYNGSFWSSLGTGVDDYVRAITKYNGSIIIGGNFNTAGTITANKITKWNLSSGTWNAMGTGMDAYVKALGVYDGTLYAGGQFTTADDLPRSNIASWYEPPAGIVSNQETYTAHTFPNPFSTSATIQFNAPVKTPN